MAITLTNMILATLRESRCFMSRGELISHVRNNYDISNHVDVTAKADEMARKGSISSKKRGMMGYSHYIHNTFATLEAMS